MSSLKVESFIREASQRGFHIDYRYDAFHSGYRIVVTKKMQVAECLIDMASYTHGGESLVVDSMMRCIRRIEEDELIIAAKNGTSEISNPYVANVRELEEQLTKYKSLVKQLSFDLEMKSTTPRAVATEADVRKQTLEMAAEFLMDYGIIKTGTELESVCEQIRKLHPTKAATMGAAAAKMGFTWKGNPYDTR